MAIAASRTNADVAPVRPVAVGGRWLVSPAFDLLFLANLAWPLTLLLPLDQGFFGHEGLQFWQVYFITTPHRWITLLVVLTDRERVASRGLWFLGLAVVVVTVCLGVRLTTGALTCLMAVDYLWNAWHFSAQHHGIFRLYQRGAAPAVVEKWLFRSFILYGILRVATATWSDTEAVDEFLRRCDWLTLAIPIWLVGRAVWFSARERPGQTVYLVSVSALFTALLFAVHFQQPRLVLALTLASALFHAIEYLAVVSWSSRRPGRRTADWLSVLAPRWLAVLGTFIVVLGVGGWLMDQYWVKTWLLINVMVAFLHYAYDGLLWRRPPKRSPVAGPSDVAATGA